MRKLLALMSSAVMLMSVTACGDKKSEVSSTAAWESGGVAALVESDGSQKISISDGTFVVGSDGKEIWFNGANTPWDNWNDFGGEFDPTFWDTHFADLHDAGVNATRVWITCNGDVGIKIKEDGTVTGAKDEHWNALDNLFAIAAEHEIYIMATLISFDHCKDSNSKYDRWRTLLQSEAAIDTYVENYLVPFVERYDSNDYLWSIDLCNEPDWIVENAECGQLGWDSLGVYFGKCAAAIHENSDILVTVGMGMIKYNSDKFSGNYVSDAFLQQCAGTENAYLDFYSPHFYEWQIPNWGNAFEKSPTDYGLDADKPAVLGECPAEGLPGSSKDLTICVETAYNNGWQGVLPWTSNGTDECGGFEEVSASAKNMYSLIPELIFPLS